MKINYLHFIFVIILSVHSMNMSSQETISFDSFTKYTYQENENSNFSQISTVLYNTEGSNYYLVFWSKNKNIKSVRLFDKKKNIFYQIKAKNFIKNLTNNNLEVESVYDLKTNIDITKFKKETFKDPNLYILNTGNKNVEKEFQQYYIEFNTSDKKGYQIGCHPDFHIRSMFQTFLDNLEGTVVRMYHIKNSKKTRIFTLKEMGQADFTVNLKL